MKVTITIDATVDVDYSEYSVEEGDDESLQDAIAADFEDDPDTYLENCDAYKVEVKISNDEPSSTDD